MSKKLPDIILILTDQQQAKMMSCAGNDYLKTPTMDSLAEEGVRFNRAYSTDPVCVPSRFSLMTGKMPCEIGLRGNYSHKIDSVPEIIKKQGAGWLLREAGYDVVYGGKTHFPKMTAEDLGFDQLTEDERDILPEVCANYLKQKKDKPFFLVASFINPHDICHMAIRDFAQTDFDFAILKNCKKEQEVLDEALKIPAGVSEEEFFEKHCPPLPDNFEPQIGEPEALKKLLEIRPFRKDAREKYTEKDWRRHRWAYCRLTERVDKQIGRLLKAIKENTDPANTVIIFTSDHGDLDSSHRLEHKTAFYEEAANVPLIVSDPESNKKNTVNDQLISNGLDLLPTLCDYAEVDAPEDLKGKSFRPLVSGKAEDLNRDYIPVQNEIGFMIVTDRYKYQLYDEGKNREQLFDLEKDPGEMINFARDPRYKETLEELRILFKKEWANNIKVVE